MLTAAQRAKEMRGVAVRDARLPAVRRRVAEQAARLKVADEERSLEWIEAVSEFGADHR